MKVVHLSYSDHAGGAARVAYRLHAAFGEAGIESSMLVLDRQTGDPTVVRAVDDGLWARAKFYMARSAGLRLDEYLNPRFNFSSGLIGVPQGEWLSRLKGADIVQAHFTTRFISDRLWSKIVRDVTAPIVWHAHDFERFTGGCHYPGSCDRWQAQCGSCPQTRTVAGFDPSGRGQRVRARIFERGRHAVVAHSEWQKAILEKCSVARAPITLIPMAVNERIFKPVDKAVARQALGLSVDANIVFAMAADFDDPRKGGKFLVDGLRMAWDRLGASGSVSPHLLTAGSVDIARRHSLSWPTTHLGPIADDRLLVLAYAAADCFICPSQEDAGPLTVVEAMMCGTPVVATNGGLAPDLIVDGWNGYVVPGHDPSRLAVRIGDVFSHKDSSTLRANARASSVGRHGYAPVAEAFMRLYASLSRS